MMLAAGPAASGGHRAAGLHNLGCLSSLLYHQPINMASSREHYEHTEQHKESHTGGGAAMVAACHARRRCCLVSWLIDMCMSATGPLQGGR